MATIYIGIFTYKEKFIGINKYKWLIFVYVYFYQRKSCVIKNDR